MKEAMRYLLVASVVSLIAACGGAQPAADAPAEAPAAPAPEPAPAASEAPPAEAPPAEAAPASPPTSLAPQKPWADLGRDERIAHMKSVVAPHMKTLFQASPEAEEFKDFGCTTCHGPGAKEGKFTMPNPALPKLDPKDGFKAHMDKEPEMTKFMMESVLPEMAKTLGQTPFDAKTKSGLMCGACHLIKK